MTRLSFNEDPAVKDRYLTRLQDHVTAGNFQFSPVWENGKGSAPGCTIEADDIDAYADQLGIPVALAAVLDSLVNAQWDGSTSAPATEFALQWLRMMPVGVDLSPVPGVVLCELLDHPLLRETAAAHPSIEKMRDTVIGLHRAALNGEAVPSARWRETRRDAVRTTDAAKDDMAERAARVIEAAVWPHLTRSALRDTMDAVSRLVNDIAMRDIGWSTAEEEATFAKFAVIFDEKVADGEHLFGSDLLAELTRRDPVSGGRFAERNAAMTRSRLVYVEAGRSILDKFQALGDGKPASCR